MYNSLAIIGISVLGEKLIFTVIELIHVEIIIGDKGVDGSSANAIFKP